MYIIFKYFYFINGINLKNKGFIILIMNKIIDK